MQSQPEVSNELVGTDYSLRLVTDLLAEMGLLGSHPLAWILYVAYALIIDALSGKRQASLIVAKREHIFANGAVLHRK